MKIEIDSLIETVRIAGKLITSYFINKSYSTHQKDDGSPVTDADIASNQFLVDELSRLYRFPVISEESHQAIDAARKAPAFWLLDPLDGTNAFIDGRPEFSINLTLIDEHGPRVGLIYAPTTNEVWYATRGLGAYYQNGNLPPAKLPLITPAQECLLKSHSFDGIEAKTCMQRCHIGAMFPMSSAIKFGHLAMGKASAYLRMAPSHEWDTASGQLIVEEAGGKIFMLKTKSAPVYLQPQFKNGPFLALAQGVSMDRFSYLFT
jgi:3'(2'), 5'-bisphosphate nucleotidase